MAFHCTFRFLLAMGLVSVLAACNLSGGVSPSATAPPPTAMAAPTTVGQCSNPLQPVIIHATWSYAMSGASSGTLTRTITAVRDNGFTEEQVFDGGGIQSGEWTCDQGALTASLPPESINALLQALATTARLQATHAGGVTIPAIVQRGESWTQTFNIQEPPSAEGQGAQQVGTASFTCTAADSETVVVPAGSFDAVRIGCRINGTMSVTTAGLDVATELASQSTVWFTRSLGMVRTENEISGVGHTTFELVSYTVP